MSWENRSRSKRKYYYRSKRTGSKVTKQYLGKSDDPVVQVIAKADHLGQVERAASVKEVRLEQLAYKQLQPLLSTLAKRLQEGVRVCLSARGFWRKMGEWKAMETTKMSGERRANDSANDRPTREVFEHLVAQASRGDRDAADQVRRIIRDHRDIWDAVGDLNKHAETSLINMISGNNLVLRESLRAKVDDLRSSLRGNSREEADRLLADHVVTTWLEIQYTRMAAIQPQQNVRDARFWSDRHDRAHTRYLAAVKELIAVRELLGHTGVVVPMPESEDGQPQEGDSSLEASVE